MAKSGRRSAAGSAETGARREALVEAAFQTLRDDGFARASARAIAGRAGCNSALVFYYFDSVNELLVEALARSSREQLQRYEEALADVTGIDELVTSVRRRLQDDMASGHVRVLVELMGAVSSDERLRSAVLAQVKPWMALTERTIERILSPSGLGGLVPSNQAAFVVVALFLGVELLADVAGADETIDGLFDSAQQLMRLLGAMLPTEPTT
ncbi:MAG: TetR/AcrR family transcriptional regulator [Acidimicrobiia bacterium]|jgi:AcrR family transcriptional regulator|nr:TetR/AcrR family transcriptional regulator [Acidimicrobiia bacterium]